MDAKLIIVTGGAGFLGSAITADLARDHEVIALDRREPSETLVSAAPTVDWHLVDITDHEALSRFFHAIKRRCERIDAVLHLAAYYHFGSDWRSEYQRTNVEGTSAVAHLAAHLGARRFLFASSVAAMRPPPPGQALTEQSPAAEFIPYAKSKSLGEQLVESLSDRMPSIVMRIGGVYSDWCELPPLCSLMRLWGGWFPLNRLVVGNGNSGVPLIHRHDLVRFVRACVEQSDRLEAHEVLLASQPGAVLHRDMYGAIRHVLADETDARPIHIPVLLARTVLGVKLVGGAVIGRMPDERPWMLRYVDRPWSVDTTYTRNKLGWHGDHDIRIQDRLPIMLDHFLHRRREWERRNRARNKARYVYLPD